MPVLQAFKVDRFGHGHIAAADHAEHNHLAQLGDAGEHGGQRGEEGAGRLGHDAGDVVLKKISQCIRENIRETDVAIRFGGEEVLILANNIQPGTAQVLGEKIRKAISEIPFSYAKKEFTKTASIGVAEFPTDSQHFWICIKNADTALYVAKETGRNRVVEYEVGMRPEE